MMTMMIDVGDYDVCLLKLSVRWVDRELEDGGRGRKERGNEVRRVYALEGEGVLKNTSKSPSPRV